MIKRAGGTSARAERLEARCLLSQLAVAVDAAVKDRKAAGGNVAAVMGAGQKYSLGSLPELSSLVAGNGADASASLVAPPDSSRPGAPVTVYLDFTGDTTAAWGSFSPGTTPAYDTDGDPTTFSSTELSNITAIWEQVADAFSPFNVNVTTVDPGTIDGPNLEVVIGGSGGWAGGNYGGIAYVGSYASADPLYGINKVFVFPGHLGNGSPRYVGDDSAHEIGHAFGLNHQSTWNGSQLTEYNTGNASQAPIMGNALGSTRALWWYGTTDWLAASGQPAMQDDLSILTSTANGFGYRADDYGDTIATAYSLSGTNAFSADGVIETNDDADWFSFTTLAGGVNIAAQPAIALTDHPMLNVDLQLFDATGTLLASGTQSTLAKSISADLPAGTYYVDVSGDGTYGDLGQYSLNITAPSPMPDRLEPNNSFAQATDLGPVVSVTQSDLSIDSTSDSDYFMVDPVDTGRLSAQISFNSLAGNIGLYLYDKNEGLIGSSLVNGNNLQSVSANVVGGQVYYLCVAGIGGAINPQYTLAVNGPDPSWLSNQGGLVYNFSGSSSLPVLNISAGVGRLIGDAGAALPNLTLNVGGPGVAQVQVSQNLAALQITGDGAVALVAGSGEQITTGSLQMSSGATLDLGNGSLVLDDSSTSAMAMVQKLVTNAYDAGQWNQPGITSSEAASKRPYFGVGFSNAVIPDAILVKSTWYGDANLDGVVNMQDIGLIESGRAGNGTDWQEGDFNYDQKITSDDFLAAAMSIAYGAQTVYAPAFDAGG